MSEAAPKGRYRLNVGIVLFNADGKVLIGRRADRRGEKIWQFPQGGVDKGEALLAAARRELQEETGVRSTAFLARAPGYVTYDFPPGFTGSKAMKGYSGQKQAWFAFRFTGEESEIDLGKPPAAEFDAWRWETLEATPDLVADFKREAYLKVVEAFSSLSASPVAPKGSPRSILMIHGFGCTGAAFSSLSDAMERLGWRVSAPTLGANLRLSSPPDPRLVDVQFQDYVAEAETWTRRLATEDGQDPVLVGHDMGARIVRTLLGRGLGRAGVLITPFAPASALRPLSAPWALSYATALGRDRSVRRPIRPGGLRFSYGYLNRAARDQRRAARLQTAYDSPRVLRQLAFPDAAASEARADSGPDRAPVLTLAAGADRTSPLAWATSIARGRAAGGDDLIIYPQSGHWLIDEPATETVAADIHAWLERHQP